MDWYEKSHRESRYQHGCKSPSFSSTLLDSIYRSIDDECDNRRKGEPILYQETMRKKHSNRSCNFQQEQHKNVPRSWVEKASDFEDGFCKSHRDNMSMMLNSNSSSSESSFGGFSSSEAESLYGARASVFTSKRPKPVRSVLERFEKPPQLHEKTHYSETSLSSSLPKDRQKMKQEGSIKSKSKAASKIYAEMKKSKQPMSPGRRLASFFNSIFAVRNVKKTKVTASNETEDMNLDRKPSSSQLSTCSSAAAYSRSCLSKSPVFRGQKPDNGAKRSVRFYPVSVIVDENCRPCGQKCLYEDGWNSIRTNREEVKFHLMEKSKTVEKAANDLLKGYTKKQKFLGQVLRDVHEDGDEDFDIDTASCSSSDLFELENLAAIGIERYREELPVYETTNFNTNRAIAKGLFL